MPWLATVLTAERVALSLYSARPMVTALMLSSRTRIPPAMKVIQAVRRLYQPDTRAMWSSYQFSIDVRNRSMSPFAFAASDCSESFSGPGETGMLSMRSGMPSMVVCPDASVSPGP